MMSVMSTVSVILSMMDSSKAESLVDLLAFSLDISRTAPRGADCEIREIMYYGLPSRVLRSSCNGLRSTRFSFPARNSRFECLAYGHFPFLFLEKKVLFEGHLVFQCICVYQNPVSCKVRILSLSCISFMCRSRDISLCPILFCM